MNEPSPMYRDKCRKPMNDEKIVERILVWIVVMLVVIALWLKLR